MANGKDQRTSVPTRFADSTPPPPQPSGDFSYTLEVVMGMQATLGKLVEAVEQLKDKTKSNSDKLEQIGKEVHTAKVILAGIGTVLALLLAAAAKSLFDHWFK